MEEDFDRKAVLLAVARLIWKHENSIRDLYSVLGVDLDNYRVDAGTSSPSCRAS